MTHGDDFVVTGPTDRFADLKYIIAVSPIKTKFISYGSTESIKALNRRLYWRKRGVLYQHHSRHLGVLVKDHGLEHVNSWRTPAIHEVTNEEPELVD